MMDYLFPLLDISAERKRQVAEEGFTADHDDQNNTGGELALAAAAYALEAAGDTIEMSRSTAPTERGLQ